MSEPAIQVEGLGKQYRIGARRVPYHTLRETLVTAARTPFRRLAAAFRGGAAPETEATVWALRDVSFTVQPGEALGLIGRNGAGKSTLLKVLSRITPPTEGRAEITGRVASLLEVGTGFHPELTGRENIYLNGAILGMRKAEIARKFDEIVAFAEIEKFLDTPIKHYSSGMYVRLAFAVAAHLEPEVLLVDEVLAVGDASFQAKSLAKMAALFRQGGTVVFVSHNLQAVKGLCRRAILLDQGRILEQGEPDQVVHRYLKEFFRSSAGGLTRIHDDPGSAPGNENIRVRRIYVSAAGASEAGPLEVGQPAQIVCEYWNLAPNTSLVLVCSLYTPEGTPVFVSQSTSDEKWHGRPLPTGLYRSVCDLPGDLLNDGPYRVRMLFMDPTTRPLFNLPEAAFFEVTDNQPRDIAWYGKFIGVVRPRLRWRTEQVSAGNALPPKAARPRILLLADRRGWYFDTTAQYLQRHLSESFDFRTVYVEESPDLNAWPFDLLYVFFWGETYHQRQVRDPARVLKGVTSHRWQTEDFYGRLTPAQMAAKYLADAGTVAVLSRRLEELLAPHREVLRVVDGVDPELFFDRGQRAGGLRLGWAGNIHDPCKGLKELLRPATNGQYSLEVADGRVPHGHMNDFYNRLDVLCIASTAEGQPLPLIEGMAAGCFPVATDVGIVPELVRHKENGLIVERSVAGFREAFRWCQENLGQVRDGGRANAQLIRQTRTWELTAATYGEVFRRALAKNVVGGVREAGKSDGVGS